MQTATNDPTVAREVTELQRIRAHLDRSEFAEGLRLAESLLPSLPENRDLLYMTAVSQRYLERLPDALSTLARLEQGHPHYSRLFQERGHCFVAMRSAQPAIEAFRRAVTLNPSLQASWKSLQLLFSMTGRKADAEYAASHLAALANLPPEIVTATSMFDDGEIESAERLVRHYLLTHGDHIEGMRLLARIGMKLDVADDAELLLENVLRMQPDYHAARYQYAMVLLQRHKHARAREEMEKLLQIEPDNLAYRTTHATVCTGFGTFDRAIPVYREVLAVTPQDAELHLSIAHALKTLGNTSEAIDSYRAAARIRPGYGDAYWSLANLKTYRFTDGEIASMRAHEAEPRIDIEDRFHLCFAMGKALEDRAEYAESYAYYERGNGLKKSTSRYRPEPLERSARLQVALCDRGFFEARRDFGSDSVAPIFIVGLPRSGSTLIEQILASHSAVEGTMELADIPRLVQELQDRETLHSNPRYPAILERMSAGDFRTLADRYLNDTRVYRRGKARFIDKMPNNFRHLPLIRLMFPNAKIIDARRDAMACCFSNFKQLFASGQQFTYGVDDITRYYRMYLDLMTHWDAAAPGAVLRVEHEDVVEDLGSNVRRILDFCELDFEPQCIDFHKTRRTVHTASSEQVRQPINREGVEQWRKYEPWLGPMKSALSALDIAWR